MTINDQTVERYENDAEAARRRLSNSLDELTVKLTPGGVLDEVLTYAKAGGGDFMKALGRSAAANPLPALLIGVGCAMFITGRGRLGRASEDGYGDRRNSGWWQPGEARGDQIPPSARGRHEPSTVGRVASSAGSALSSAAGSVRDAAVSVAGGLAHQAQEGAGLVGAAASGVVGKIGEGASAAGQSASNVAGSVADAAGGAAAQVADTARSAAATAADYAGGVGETIAERSRRAATQADTMRRNISDATATLVREQPLLVAAGGLVVGAAIAALFPRTAFEDSVMGEASDAVKDTVGEVASGTLDSAAGVVERVADEVTSKAQAEGLTPDNAAESLKTLGDKMAKVATAGAEVAREETEKVFRPAG